MVFKLLFLTVLRKLLFKLYIYTFASETHYTYLKSQKYLFVTEEEAVIPEKERNDGISQIKGIMMIECTREKAFRKSIL